jgi:hypothetical protein
MLRLELQIEEYKDDFFKSELYSSLFKKLTNKNLLTLLKFSELLKRALCFLSFILKEIITQIIPTLGHQPPKRKYNQQQVR